MHTSDNLTFIGTGLSSADHYSTYEQQCWQIVSQQIKQQFPYDQNLLISMTWFGPAFNNYTGWQDLLDLEATQQKFDNVFLLATVDPPQLNVTEIQEVKNKVQALKIFYLGNFDSVHQFNFFAPILAKNFKVYEPEQLILKEIAHVYINYNRKPRQHRVKFVRMLVDRHLDKCGVVTLGRDLTNDFYITLGEKQEDYTGTTVDNFGLPMDYYSLHRLDLWSNSFLYINGATEFDPINDLFCQQDTFKPMLGLRPFVINGVQRTYRWLRNNGFKTFNHYWSHIDIEQGDVHQTLIELVEFLNSQPREDLLDMYNNMLPDLWYNKERFFEFAKEQQYKMENLFK